MNEHPSCDAEDLVVQKVDGLIELNRFHDSECDKVVALEIQDRLSVVCILKSQTKGAIENTVVTATTMTQSPHKIQMTTHN